MLDCSTSNYTAFAEINNIMYENAESVESCELLVVMLKVVVIIMSSLSQTASHAAGLLISS